MKTDPSLAIDIAQIIRAKRKDGKAPKLLVAILKKLTHVDQINEYLVKGYEGVDFCVGAMETLDVTLDVEGMENLVDGQRYTFVSNHPLGGIDGVALGAVFGRRFDGHVRYLVNDILMFLKGLAPICVPINIIGGQSRDLPRLIDEAFASDEHMIVFPAGKCSRKIDGRIQDRAWGKAFVAKSVQTGRQVVPVHFCAENSKAFYRWDRFFQLLRIKANLTMLFLPDEMFKARHSTFRIRIGKPIPPETFDRSRSTYEWAQWVREEVYKL